MNTEKIYDQSMPVLFQELGLSRPESRILLVLIQENKIMSGHDIEKLADLRQPEISTGTHRLLERKWIAATKQILPERGRCETLFGLSITVSEIIRELTERLRKEQAVQNDKLHALEAELCKKKI